jgi:predicted nucleic acid-binding protein
VSYIVDSSIWVDFFRAVSPIALKRQAAKLIDDQAAMICEPVLFELLGAASAAPRKKIEAHLGLLPLAPTPHELWSDAARLGQKCIGRGLLPPAMDLLIAQVCLDHDLELVTSDQHFADITRVSPLRARILDRALK